MPTRFDTVSRMIEQAVDRCRRANIPPAIYSAPLKALELACVHHIIADARQTVSGCREPGTTAMAERQGITPRSMRRRRHGALEVLTQVGRETRA
jgi:hypothetical protein